MLIIYLNNISKEGMCSLDEYNYEFNPKLIIIKILLFIMVVLNQLCRVLPNGEKIVINVDKNSDVTASQLNDNGILQSRW